MGFDGRTVVLTQRSLFRNTVTRQVRIQIEDVTTIRFIKSAKRRLGALGHENGILEIATGDGRHKVSYSLEQANLIERFRLLRSSHTA